MDAGLFVFANRVMRIGTGNRREHGDIDFAKIAPRLIAQLMQLLEFGLELLRRHQYRRPAIANRDSITNRAIIAAPDASRADDDRWMRLLRGFRITAHRRKLDEPPLDA